MADQKQQSAAYVARSAIRSVVQEELKKLVVPAVGEAIALCLKDVEQRLVSTLSYKGQWQESQTYVRGNFCSMGGSLWHCNRDNTTTRPGTDDSWTLAVKSGRDGRDGRDAAAPVDHPLEPERSERRITKSHR